MNNIIKGMIGCTVEVYVDDIVVKLDSHDQHVKDMDEVFKALRRMSMRLNPGNCAFGVDGGKFLGFMLIHWGIEANSYKCRALTKMKRPQNMIEVQKLIGRLTALSRFVARLTEQTKPVV